MVKLVNIIYIIAIVLLTYDAGWADQGCEDPLQAVGGQALPGGAGGQVGAGVGVQEGAGVVVLERGVVHADALSVSRSILMPHPRRPADWAQTLPGLSYVDTAEAETRPPPQHRRNQRGQHSNSVYVKSVIFIVKWSLFPKLKTVLCLFYVKCLLLAVNRPYPLI